MLCSEGSEKKEEAGKQKLVYAQFPSLKAIQRHTKEMHSSECRRRMDEWGLAPRADAHRLFVHIGSSGL